MIVPIVESAARIGGTQINEMMLSKMYDRKPVRQSMSKRLSTFKFAVPRSFTKACLVAAMAANLFGCAVDPSASPANRQQPIERQGVGQGKLLSIVFARPQVKDQISSNGLLPRFQQFWQAYLDRDWAKRFQLERADAPLSERFYIPYHARAWALQSLEVSEFAESEPGKVRLTLLLELVNPDGGRIEKISRVENWALIDGKWWHRTDDPMLTGIR